MDERPTNVERRDRKASTRRQASATSRQRSQCPKREAVEAVEDALDRLIVARPDDDQE
jgi:hypothetical protein